MPCWDCYDFEAAVAHEMGHVLGFGHPDAEPEANLIGACDVSNATCRHPFDCAAQTVRQTCRAQLQHCTAAATPGSKTTPALLRCCSTSADADACLLTLCLLPMIVW